MPQVSIRQTTSDSQSHVKAILEVPTLKKGNGKEVRKLHDTLQQHLHALDASESSQLCQFITSLIQLKLDPDRILKMYPKCHTSQAYWNS